MPMLGGKTSGFKLPKFTALDFDQAAPVQNTYYTALEVKNVEIYGLCIKVATTGETVEWKITIDGEVFISSGVAVNANEFTQLGGMRISLMGEASQYVTSGASAASVDITYSASRPIGDWLKGRSVKVEVRKTTAAGAGTISVRGAYGQY